MTCAISLAETKSVSSTSKAAVEMAIFSQSYSHVAQDNPQNQPPTYC